MMWVYRPEIAIKTGEPTGKWEVGYFVPAPMTTNGKAQWLAVHVFATLGDAMRLTNYLNGGNGDLPPSQLVHL